MPLIPHIQHQPYKTAQVYICCVMAVNTNTRTMPHASVTYAWICMHLQPTHTHTPPLIECCADHHSGDWDWWNGTGAETVCRYSIQACMYRYNIQWQRKWGSRSQCRDRELLRGAEVIVYPPPPLLQLVITLILLRDASTSSLMSSADASSSVS